MDASPNLSLPYLAGAQAQKHVTHNEALRLLDALVQLSVLDRDTGTPPASPENGDRYIVASGATGVWAGRVGSIAAFQDGAWSYLEPKTGWRAWIIDESVLLVYSGGAWSGAASGGGGGEGSVNPAPFVGINTTASVPNRLAVSSPSSLFNHEGNDHRLGVNKATAGDTASVVFQDAFSARAEIGLAGDDDLRLKVSHEGSLWRDALVVDRSTGNVTMPSTAREANLLINGNFAINQRGYGGGAISAGGYCFDRWKAGPGDGTFSLTADTFTLAAGSIVQVLDAALWGSLGGQTLTVSVEDLTGGTLVVTIGSQSASILPGTGRRAATVTLGVGETGNIAVTFASAAGVITFKRAKLERGTIATPWLSRSSVDELRLCQRYFQRITTAPYLLGVCRSALIIYSQRISLFTAMRATPAVTLTNSAGTTSVWEYLAASWLPASTTAAVIVDNAGFTITMNGSSLTSGQGILVAGLWRADAEL